MTLHGHTPNHSHKATSRVALLTLLAIAMPIACIEMTSIPDDAEDPGNDLLVEDMLLPVEVVVGVGQSVRIRATFLNGRGEVVPGKVDEWASLDATIAGVDSDGLVSALSVGTTEVVASATKGKGKKDQAPGQIKKKTKIKVSPDTVASVEVTPASAELLIDQTIQLTAVTRDADGNVLQDRLVEWSSSDAQIVSVDNGGKVTTIAPGAVTITATSEGKHGTATIVVVNSLLQIAIWPGSVSLEEGQRIQFYMAQLFSDGQTECDDSEASRDTNVLFNLTDYPAACDSAIARLNP